MTELACSYSLTHSLDRTDVTGAGVLLFNVLAFAFQPIVGWAVDRWDLDRSAAAAGAVLVLLGLLVAPIAVWTSIGLLGLGNACFHVGGGSQCVRQSGGCAGPLGLFVGPGAIGLTVGVGLARTDTLVVPIMIGAGVVIAAAAALCLRPAASPQRPSPEPLRRFAQSGGIPVALVLICIGIRSFVGTGVQFGWNSSAVSALALGLAITVGKMGGGLLADRCGWAATSVAVIILSAPALFFGATGMIAGLLGAALFQAPMAITLGALVLLIPGRPGLSFGLASAAVYGGSLFLFADATRWLQSVSGLAVLSLSAVVMLVLALRHTCRRAGV